MYLGILAFAGGVLLKTAFTLFPGFKKKDWKGVLTALFIGVYAFISSLEDFSIQVGALFSLVAFVATISFAFKDRILPKITEGTLLLYGIVSLYLFEIYFKFDALAFVIAEKILIIYCLTIFVLCITRIRAKPVVQIILFICFLLLNISIILAFVQYGNFNLFCSTCETNNITHLGSFFTGFIFFQLASNLLFILYFAPVTLSKRESYKQRIAKIKKHVEDLERKYIDIDIGFSRTIFILFVGAMLFVNHQYSLVDDGIMITLSLILGDILTSSPAKKDLPGHRTING